MAEVGIFGVIRYYILYVSRRKVYYIYYCWSVVNCNLQIVKNILK